MKLGKVFRRLTEVTNIGLVIGTLLLLIVMSQISPTFLTLYNLEIVAMNYVTEGIMALGMTLVIIAGGIDLSVGALLAFSAIVVGSLLQTPLGITLSILITLLVVGILGFLNALMINHLQADSFIVTLATMIGVGGMSLVISRGSTIYGFPQRFFFFGQGRVFGVPFPLFLFAIFAIILGVLLKKHRYVHQAYFVGTNPDAAHLCGINVEGFRIFVYVLSAILAGVAGVITASMYTSAAPMFGINIELRVIAAVIISGASLSGGRGSIGRTILGIVFLALVNNIFIQANLPTFWKQIVLGSIIISAVMSERWIRVKRTSIEESWQGFMLSSRGGG